jgi:uncharacterized protein
MTRLLILVGLIALAVWWVVTRVRGGSRGERGGGSGRQGDGGAALGPASKSGGDAAAAPMVACAHCGVHLPRPDALADGEGRLYCGDEHRLAGPR